MRQHILATALAAAVTALAYGQNLNPTVEVTNAYEGGASSIVKPAQQMAVPDSVMKFNLDFDYSVFEKPYQGAYEFKPYYVQLKPAPRASTEDRFYLRAGAGFTLHPELDLVWTPLRKEQFHVNVYATHRSYFGRYHRIGVEESEDHLFTLAPTGDKMKGFLTDTKAGVDATYGWTGGVATVDVAYRHRMAEDDYLFRRMNGVEFAGRVRSLPSDVPHFLYDVAVDYHYLTGNHSQMTYLGEPAQVMSAYGESWFKLDGTLGPVLDAGSRLLVDLDMQVARYVGDFAGYTGNLAATPKYIFALDSWGFSLGARVSSIIYSDDYSVWPAEYQRKSIHVFPDVHVDYHLIDDRLVLQTAATGSDRFSTVSGRFEASPFSCRNDFGHSVEWVRAMIGARGNVSARFRYDFQAGYARMGHAPVDGYRFFPAVPKSSTGVERPASWRPAQYEESYNLLFAELDYGWKSDYVTVDGRLAYRWTNIKGNSDLGGAFAPAAFTGFIRPAFNWGGRFQAGIDAEWSTSRKITNILTTSSVEPLELVYKVPGWVDLGLFAEYRFSHNLGFWAKGGNLLNQAIQRIPEHAEAGMYFTAGILLNF